MRKKLKNLIMAYLSTLRTKVPRPRLKTLLVWKLHLIKYPLNIKHMAILTLIIRIMLVYPKYVLIAAIT